MSEFKSLAPELTEALPDLGYKKPTKIQKKAIPELSHSRSYTSNFLISAPTGSGKTEAVLFPILSKILEKRKKKKKLNGFKVLYIAPLRALNRDILVRMLPLLSDKLNLKTGVRNSDTSSYQRRKQAKTPPEILITTPETFQILFCGKLLRKNLKNVDWVVVDEFHSIMDSKRGIQLSVGLERLHRLTKYSLFGLGAGIQNKKKALNYLAGGREGKIIKGREKRNYEIEIKAVPPRLKVNDSPLGFQQEVRIKEITNKIANIVKDTEGKVLVFSNTRTTVELIGAFMQGNHPKIDSAVHHSSLGADVRRRVEKEFKEGELDCVIATSSLELGIDIGHCDLVIQIMSPRRIEIAIQRIGRSKHKAGKAAKGIIIAGTADSLFESLGVADLCGKELEAKRIPKKPYDVLAHQTIGMLRGEYIENEKYLTKKEVFRIVAKAWPYRNFSFHEFNQILRFLDQRVGLINLNGKNLSLSGGAIPYYFNHLSTIPNVVKYDVVDIEKGEKVGELDQKFVIEVEPGDVFLLSGLPREILEIKTEEGKILTRSSGASALPPKWEGEMIPVSWKLSRYVGNLRKKYHREKLESVPINQKVKEMANDIVKQYPEDKRFPDETNLVAEADLKKGIVVMHFPFGTKVNNTISILLKHFLKEDKDFPIVGVDSDAYRIFLHTFKSSFLNESSIFNSLEQAINKTIDYSLDEQEFKHLIYDAVISSKTSELGWHLVQVLTRFGVLGGSAHLVKNQIKKLVGSYRDTPPLREAINEFIFSHMDLSRTQEILKQIGYEKTLWFTTGVSPLGLGAPSSFSTDVEDMNRLIDRKYEQRLLNKKLKYICLNCAYNVIKPAKNPLKNCPKCKASLITVTKRQKDLEKIIEKAEKGKLTEEERNKFSSAHKIARSMKSDPRLTSKVIATTGIGAKQAVSIIKKHSVDHRRLIKELRKRERHYWQYHHIWEEDT